jgi:hypothetical protein
LKKSKKRKALFGVAVVCWLLFAAVAPASTSDYLEAVRAELEEFDTGKFTLAPGSPWISRADSGVGIADVEGFTTFLRRELPGTYILFVRLPPPTRVKIFEEYINTGDLGKARSDIYNLLYRGR